MMFKVEFISLIILFAGMQILAKHHEPHLHSEVKIVEYNGPLTREMLSLFKSAEIIEFVDCNITSIPDKMVSLLPKLKKMISVNLTLDNVHAEAAEGNTQVEEFEFIGNDWKDVKLRAWNGLEHLKRLTISNHRAPIVEIEANSLNRTKLKYLEVSYSGVEKIDDLAFHNLGKLETLILSGNKLKTISKEMLSPLKSLEKLDLHENLLESFDISQLPNLPKLKTINLSKNPLKTLVLDGVEKVAPKLKTVEISDTTISEEQLQDLRKDTKIEIKKQIFMIINS